MFEDLLGAIAASPGAVALKASRIAYPIVNALHILGIASLFGSILALDLRLLGLFRTVPASAFADALPKVAGAGLAVAGLTGVLLFSVDPEVYAANAAFRLKLVLVLLGTLHAMLLHRSSRWAAVRSGSASVSTGLRFSAALSLAVWTAAIFCGRFIAFD